MKSRWRPAIALFAAASILTACGGGGFTGGLDEGHTGIVISTVEPQLVRDAPLGPTGIDEAPRLATPAPGSTAAPAATRVSEVSTPSVSTSTPTPASKTPAPSATAQPSVASTPAATTIPAASQLQSTSTTSCRVSSPASPSKVDTKRLPGNNGTTLTQTIETKTYAVGGCDSRDILTSLNSSTSSSGDGRHEVGLTSSTTKYSFTYVSQPNSCKLHSANIETQITVTLPELVNTSGVSADILARWQTFLQALRTHEQGHVDIILKASTDMQAAFDGAGSQATCQQLETTLKSYVQQQTDASNAANAAYDTQTNHGVNQGVAFP